MGGIGNQIFSSIKRYPLKKRVIFAASTCAVLLVGSMNWKFEPAKTIVISALSIACLFDLRGRWSMFFWGIGIGDLLLYLSK